MFAYRHWPMVQLSTLMGAHFVSDMTLAVFAGTLPFWKDNFHLNDMQSFVLLGYCGVAANLFQLPIGFFRKDQQKLLLLPIGILLSMAIGFPSLLPSATPCGVLLCVVIVIHLGGAMVHPEGFRGTLGITRFAAERSTPCFIVAGFLGTAVGPVLGTWLLERFGTHGLWGLVPLYLFVFAMLFVTRIRLAVDVPSTPKTQKTIVNIPLPTVTPSCHSREKSRETTLSPWNFPTLFVIACFVNTGTTFFNQLTPTFLHQAGWSLRAAGERTMLLMLGAAIGSITLGGLAKWIRPSRIIFTALSVGFPLTLWMLWFPTASFAGLLTVGIGATCGSVLPLLIVLSRHVPSRIHLGLKLAIMVGGSWGVAAVVFFSLTPFLTKIGLYNAMSLIGVAYTGGWLVAVLLQCQRVPEMVRISKFWGRRPFYRSSRTVR